MSKSPPQSSKNKWSSELFWIKLFFTITRNYFWIKSNSLKISFLIILFPTIVQKMNKFFRTVLKFMAFLREPHYIVLHFVGQKIYSMYQYYTIKSASIKYKHLYSTDKLLKTHNCFIWWLWYSWVLTLFWLGFFIYIKWIKRD